MLQIARDLTLHDHHGAPCTALATRVTRTAASAIATVFGASCLTVLCLTVLAPLFGPLVFSARAESRDIVVFGSIALKEALSEANDYFLSENGTRAVTTIGPSTALAKQIEGGMPGDLFVAGDVASMDYLAERNLIKPAAAARPGTSCSLAVKRATSTSIPAKGPGWHSINRPTESGSSSTC